MDYALAKNNPFSQAAFLKTFDQLVAETAALITELMPWDLAEKLQSRQDLLLVDVRENEEFITMRIGGSINVPRGILEAASEFGYDETEPLLAAARDREIVVICRSGKRSCLAAHSLQQLGFTCVASLKTGLRGWNDFDQPLADKNNLLIDGDDAEQYLRPKTLSV